jgi:membrane associated rhomboid family serine protease
LVVTAVVGLIFLNVGLGVWLQSGAEHIAPYAVLNPGLIPYEVPSRDALLQGHLWTLLTFPFVERDLIWALLGLVGLGIVGPLAEADLSPLQFLVLALGSALVGACFWLPLHWQAADPANPGSIGDLSLLCGPSLMVFGLLAYWCNVTPDEPVPVRLLFIVPAEIRPRVFFWLLLAVMTGAFLNFELPALFGANAYSDTYLSAYLGAMMAGAVVGRFRAHQVWEPGSMPPEEILPRRWLQKAMPVGVVHTTEAAAAAAAPRAGRTPLANPREWREEVDRILDKINVEGFGSLSPDERDILAKAKEKLGK